MTKNLPKLINKTNHRSKKLRDLYSEFEREVTKTPQQDQTKHRDTQAYRSQILETQRKRNNLECSQRKKKHTEGKKLWIPTHPFSELGKLENKEAISLKF